MYFLPVHQQTVKKSRLPNDASEDANNLGPTSKEMVSLSITSQLKATRERLIQLLLSSSTYA